MSAVGVAAVGVATSLDSALGGSGKPPELSGCSRPRESLSSCCPETAPPPLSHSPSHSLGTEPGDTTWGHTLGHSLGLESRGIAWGHNRETWVTAQRHTGWVSSHPSAPLSPEDSPSSHQDLEKPRTPPS